MFHAYDKFLILFLGVKSLMGFNPVELRKKIVIFLFNTGLVFFHYMCKIYLLYFMKMPTIISFLINVEHLSQIDL